MSGSNYAPTLQDPQSYLSHFAVSVYTCTYGPTIVLNMSGVIINQVFTFKLLIN